LLVAPGGFGKSTLAATYARDSGAVVSWLGLQAADRDSRRLFSRLADAFDAAFEAADPAASPGLTRLPELRQGLASGSEGTGLARLLLIDLAQAPAGFILVLDDFHYVQDAEDVTQAVDALVRGLPEMGQLVITAREAPALSMTRLVAREAVFALGTEDLRFTPEEARALRQALGGDASHDDEAEAGSPGFCLAARRTSSASAAATCWARTSNASCWRACRPATSAGSRRWPFSRRSPPPPPNVSWGPGRGRCACTRCPRAARSWSAGRTVATGSTRWSATRC
jgi:hypothetical protein